MITKIEQAGDELLRHLADTAEGEPALGCMQCGLCAASCPLGEAMEFPPRKLILQARTGNLDRVLSSPALWMCVACYTCSHRCPRKIELADVLWPALRDRALQQGLQPPAELQETFQNIFKYGNTLGKSQYRSIDLPIKRASCQNWIDTSPFLQGGYNDFGRQGSRPVRVLADA